MSSDKVETILFLVPTYKYMTSRSFASFASLFLNIRKAYNAKFGWSEGMYITLARNSLAEKYYLNLPDEQKEQIDLIIWLDDDMVFSVKDVVEIAEKFESAGTDMLGGLYYNRFNCEPLVLNFDFDDKRTVVPLNVDKKSGIVKCEATGFGFLVMKPRVLDKMKEFLGKWMFKDVVVPHPLYKEGVHIGEDLYFFMKAKELGLTVAVDTDIVIGHEGGLVK